MAALLEKLPTILILAVLVGIFLALRRHVNSARLKLWTASWTLIFIHFAVEVFEPRQGTMQSILFSIDWGSLQLSAMFFVASLTSFVEQKSKTWTLLGLTALPVLIYTVAASFDSHYRALYIGCLAAMFWGTPAFIVLYRRKITRAHLAWMPLAIATGAWVIAKAWQNDPGPGFLAALTFGFGLPGFLFWMRYRRWSPGVITTAGGFLLWGAVFPVGAILDKFFPALQVAPELWNTPKFFVAFGMILTMLEDKSAVFEAANLREHKLNAQLQKFASITSRLLTGVEVNSLCHEIAQAIIETSNFQRVVILLASDDRGLYLAGHGGLSEQQITYLKGETGQWRIDDIAELCRIGSKTGENSYMLRSEEH